jgi:hypothetical protein
VHRFGQFQSIKSFLLEIVPELLYIKELKLNIIKTYIPQANYPKSLKKLTLVGFQKEHLPSLIVPLIQMTSEKRIVLSELNFVDLTI